MSPNGPDACPRSPPRPLGVSSCLRGAAAGLHVIAIPHPKYPPDPDALAAAALVLPALADLTTAAVGALA